MTRNLDEPRRASQLLEPPRNVNRGYLAEEYDGISQFVLVALSRTSTSAAYRAKVATGDFGTGKRFPVGTPVAIRSYRGGLEVLSLSASTSGRSFCDSFNRGIVPLTAPSTFSDYADNLPGVNIGGIEGNGTAWNFYGDSPTLFGIDSEGLVCQGFFSGGTMKSPSHLSLEGDIVVDILFKIDQMPGPPPAGDIGLDLSFSYGDFFLVASTSFGDDTVSLGISGFTDTDNATPISATANTWYYLKVYMSPQAIKAKIWEYGTSEPDWMTEVLLGLNFKLRDINVDFSHNMVAGTTNIHVRQIRSNHCPDSVSVVQTPGSDLIPPPDPSSCPKTPIDLFERTFSPGWDLADNGHTWIVRYDGSLTPASSSGQFSVQDGYGKAVAASSDPGEAAHSVTAQLGTALPESFGLLVKIRVAIFYTGSATTPSWSFEVGPASNRRVGFFEEYGSFRIRSLYVRDDIGIIHEVQNVFSASTEWQWFRIEHEKGVRVRVKFWDDGASEPSSWNLEVSAAGESEWDDGGSINLDLENGSGFGADSFVDPLEVDIGSIELQDIGCQEAA